MQITLVGKLVSREEKATQLILRLDDGTGIVEACIWADEGETGLVCTLSIHAAAQLLLLY